MSYQLKFVPMTPQDSEILSIPLPDTVSKFDAEALAFELATILGANAAFNRTDTSTTDYYKSEEVEDSDGRLVEQDLYHFYVF